MTSYTYDYSVTVKITDDDNDETLSRTVKGEILTQEAGIGSEALVEDILTKASSAYAQIAKDRKAQQKLGG